MFSPRRHQEASLLATRTNCSIIDNRVAAQRKRLRALSGSDPREFYFGNLDNNRVTLAKTFNLTVDTTRGSTDLGFAQVGTWWWYPAPGSTGSQMTVLHHLIGVISTR